MRNKDIEALNKIDKQVFEIINKVLSYIEKDEDIPQEIVEGFIVAYGETACQIALKKLKILLSLGVKNLNDVNVEEYRAIIEEYSKIATLKEEDVKSKLATLIDKYGILKVSLASILVSSTELLGIDE